jgi:aminocarboxymuconate-semialdehyde decarboxylase
LNSRIVDLHCHFIPPALLDRIRADGAAHSIRVTDGDKVSFAGRDATQSFPQGMLDLEDRLVWMDTEEIDIQVVSAWMDFSAYVLDPSDGVWLARVLNELTVDAIAKHSDRFRAMAAVPLQAPELAADELRYAVTELGIVSVEIGTKVADSELDDPALEPFWTTAEDLDLLVLVHPPYRSIGIDRFKRYFLDNLVSNPMEETVAAAHLIFGGVLERHTRLKICLTHGGGFLPYQIGRLDRGFDARPSVTATRLTAPPSSFLRRFYYDTVVHGSEALRFLGDRVGMDRIVLGSDYPFPMGSPHPVDAVRAAGLSDDATEAILRSNVGDAIGTARWQ